MRLGTLHREERAPSAGWSARLSAAFKREGPSAHRERRALPWACKALCARDLLKEMRGERCARHARRVWAVRAVRWHGWRLRLHARKWRLGALCAHPRRGVVRLQAGRACLGAMEDGIVRTTCARRSSRCACGGNSARTRKGSGDIGAYLGEELGST